MFFFVLVACLSVLIGRAVYRLYFHPLSHMRGPVVASVSSIFLHTICYLGIEGRILRRDHKEYATSVLRIAPNSVSISDGEAIRAIYIAGGGFLKDSRYNNFNLGPIATIFSSRDTAYRDQRAKAVAPLFSPPQIRAACGPEECIGGLIADFVGQLGQFRQAGGKMDLLDLCARLSIDVVTAYLLGESYGGMTEHAHLSLQERQLSQNKLSANPFIHAIVAFARFSLLPNRLFKAVYSASQNLSASHDGTAASFIKLDQFIGRVLRKNPTSNQPSTSQYDDGGKTHERLYYHQRLVRAGVSEAEAGAQSKAIVFAGADSTAVMLATTLFHLIQNGAARSRLLSEIRTVRAMASKSDHSSGRSNVDLPFLRAVVREGLRLGMANPTRLTRIVGPEGLRVGTQNHSKDPTDCFIPPGTIVGCAAYTLHHDPEVFPEPFSFRPERWMDDGTDKGLKRAAMTRNLIPFGAGSRACIGKNLALQQLHDTVLAVVNSEHLEGAVTCGEKIEVTEWFNGDIKGHCINIYWQGRKK